MNYEVEIETQIYIFKSQEKTIQIFTRIISSDSDPMVQGFPKRARLQRRSEIFQYDDSNV